MSENIEGMKNPEAEVAELKKRYWELNTEDYKRWEESENLEDVTEDNSRYKEIQGELVDITMKVAEICRDNNLPFDQDWVLGENRPLV